MPENAPTEALQGAAAHEVPPLERVGELTRKKINNNMSSHQQHITNFLLTGRVAKRTAAKRAHAAALRDVWRLEDLLAEAAEKEHELLPAAKRARDDDAQRAANLAQLRSGNFEVIVLE